MNKKNGAKIPPPLEGNDGAALQWKMRNISHARMHVVTDMLSEYGLHYTYPRILGTILSVSYTDLTSQGSVCGSTLALMDAGVPIKRPVAGISAGLVTNPEDEDDFITFMDIQGIEDFFGDMDFKVDVYKRQGRRSGAIRRISPEKHCGSCSCGYG